jgi:Fe-S-cluster containining protein
VAGRTVTLNSQIAIGSDAVEIEMALPADAVPLRKMLPIISMATDQFVEIGIAASRNNGESVSCSKGCSACCRQLIPISETEAFEIADIVGEMPEQRRAEVTERFANAVRRISNAGLLADLDRYGSISVPQQKELHRRYFQLRIECPLLDNDACLIHERRPLGIAFTGQNGGYFGSEMPNGLSGRIHHVPFSFGGKILTARKVC